MCSIFAHLRVCSQLDVALLWLFSETPHVKLKKRVEAVILKKMYMIPVTLRYVFILKEPKILKNKTNKEKKTAYVIIKI